MINKDIKGLCYLFRTVLYSKSNVDNQRTHTITNIKDDIQSQNSVDGMLKENNIYKKKKK